MFLVKADDNTAPIGYKGNKSYRVTCFVLATMAIAFAYLLDEAFGSKDTIKTSITVSVQLHLLTGSKSLYDIIS